VSIEAATSHPFQLRSLQTIDIKTIGCGVVTATTTISRFEERREGIDHKDIIMTIEIRLGAHTKIATTTKT
jgi:hypothetical protein